MTAGLREKGIRVAAVHHHALNETMLNETPPMTLVRCLGLGPAGPLAAARDAASFRFFSALLVVPVAPLYP